MGIVIHSAERWHYGVEIMDTKDLFCEEEFFLSPSYFLSRCDSEGF